MNFLSKLFSGGAASMSAEQAHEQLNSSTPPFLLDVRSPNEFRDAHIQGAKLIPLDDLSRRLNELPKDREILVVCRSGARSGMAAGQLVNAGFKVTNLSGGLMAWSQRGLTLVKGK
jgi:rhodanese-related sulfurtransferase